MRTLFSFNKLPSKKSKSSFHFDLHGKAAKPFLLNFQREVFELKIRHC